MVEYTRAMEGVHKVPEEVITAFVEMRALNDFPWNNKGEFSHLVSTGVVLSDDEVTIDGKYDSAYTAPLREAQDLVSSPVGEEFFEKEDLDRSLRRMYQEEGIYSKTFTKNNIYIQAPSGAGNDLKKEIRHANKDAYKIVRSISKDEISLEEGLEKLDSRIAEKVEQGIDRAIDSKGISFLKNNPELLYEKVRKHYLKGDFDDNPVGQLSAGRFLDGASKYASEHYGTNHTETVPNQVPESLMPSAQNNQSFNMQNTASFTP